MRQRLIVQMAQATDHTGQDIQAAAEEAARRALTQSSLHAPEVLGLTPEEITVRVTLGVPDPSSVSHDAIRALNTLGKTEIVVQDGGLTIQDPKTGHLQWVVCAAVEVFVPSFTGWRTRSR